MEEITIAMPKSDTNVLTIPTAKAAGANPDYNKTIRIPKNKKVIRKKKENKEEKEKEKEEKKVEPHSDYSIPGETDIREWEGFGYLYLKPCHKECDENGNYCDCPGPVYDLKTKKKLGSYLGSPNGFSPDFDDPNWSD
jgi:hypothetical protein